MWLSVVRYSIRAIVSEVPLKYDIVAIVTRPELKLVLVLELALL